jgi:leucine dehydrogenase
MKNFEFERLEEFDNHELIQFIFDEKVGLRGFIAIHRRHNKKPSLGATRLWKYQTEIDALRDALRLSKMMSFKSALVGLPYGGAKAALIFPPKIKKHRKQFFVAYARKINSLNGQFVTGTDIGLENKDVQMMRKYTPYVIGNKVDPAYYTAVGVYYGIRTALKYVFGSPEIKNRTFAVQGLGKTGIQLLKLIYPEAEKIFVTDIDKEKIKKIKQQFPKIKIVSSSAIFEQKVDVFSPCSVGGVINSKTAANLHCQIVAGSANNQLEDEYIDRLLYKLGILYAPDYVINSGGLISVADEMERGRPSKKRILQKITNIPVTLSTIFNISEKRKKPTGLVANQMAEAELKSNQPHL